MPRAPNKFERRRRHVECAQQSLTKAAAALCDYPLEQNALAYALAMGAIGLLEIAKADADENALATVTSWLEQAKAEATR
jgi:hypothetical protein